MKPTPKIAVIGNYRAFRNWMAENPDQAGKQVLGGCQNAICLSEPEHIHRVRGIELARIIVLQDLPGMSDVMGEIRSRLRLMAA